MKILQLDDSNSKRMEVQSVLKRMGIRGSVWVQSVEEGVDNCRRPACVYHNLHADSSCVNN